MPINDFISDILVKTGLKKTEDQLCADAISHHEERIRDLNDHLAELLDEVARIEHNIRNVKEQYDAATSASKPLYAERLRSLMRDLERVRELQMLTLRNLEKEKMLLQERRIEREHIRHPSDPDIVSDAIERKEEVIADLQEEDGELSRLETTVYSKDPDLPAGPITSTVDEERLNREVEALLGDAATLEREKPSESPEEIA